MADHYDELTGDDLEASFQAANGPTDGGSNQDGSLSADEKRQWLRDNTETYENAQDNGLDAENPYGLTDAERAEAQSRPYPRPLADDLRRAHAEADTDAIKAVTADINDYRERQFANLRG